MQVCLTNKLGNFYRRYFGDQQRTVEQFGSNLIVNLYTVVKRSSVEHHRPTDITLPKTKCRRVQEKFYRRYFVVVHNIKRSSTDTLLC